jgi:GH24 family phage-related lysozyme (muramidase)
MAELPRVPIPDSATQPVRTSVSSAEVAAPYAEIAHGLNKAGEALTETSVDLAQKAGEQAVRTDDSGNLVVDKAPFLVGPAAPAFARAARMTYAGKLQPQIETDMLKLRLEHPNDPQAFQTAAKSYADEKLGQIDDPTLKVGIGKMLSENAAHNYRTSLIDANQQNTTEALQTYQARIKDMNERGATLARQDGTDTPEYQSLAHDRMALYKELGDDPRFKFSPERAALEMRENRDNDVGQAVIGQAQRIFQTKQNAAAAQKFLQDAFWGDDSERLNLSAAKRDHFVAEGMHALANLSAIDRQAVSDNVATVKGYTTDIYKNPSRYDEGFYQNLLQRSRDIGDIKSEQELIKFKDLLPTATNLKKMGPEQATVALSQMARGNLPDNISFAGIPDKFIAGIKQSEGFQARAQWDYKQFTNGYGTRALHSAEVIDKETAERRFDQEISKAAKVVDAVNPTLDAGTRAALTSLTFNAGSSWVNGTLGKRVAAGDIAGARDAFLQYNRAGGQVLPALVNRRAQEASWFGKDEAPGGTMRPGEHVDMGIDNGITRQFRTLTNIQQERVKQFAERAFTDIEKAVKDRDQFKPGELENFAEMAHLSGRDDLIEKVGPMLAAKDIQDKLPEGTSAAVVQQQIKALEASGVSGPERAVLKQLHENVKADAAALEADPLGQGARNGWFAANNQFNLANSSAVVGEVQDRVRKAEQVRQHEPTKGPISLIGKDEAAEIGTKLTSGDPQQAMQMLQALKTIPDKDYLPTMVALKEPIINMSRSNDPTRFGAGMTALSTLWQTHKPEFEALFGGDVKNRMLAFQGLQGSLDVPTIIARLNAADDPAMAKSRADIGEAVNEETKKWAPTDVAYQLGSSYGIPGTGFISRAIGSTPAVSTSELTAGEMKHDFIDTYKALREYGVAKDTALAKAVEGLKSEWQVSQVNGNSLMKNAPETHYPMIAGNHDWMRVDLQDHIASILGPQVTMGDDGTFKQNWTFQSILSDPQTAREVKSPPPGPDGKPRGPSYQIVVMDDRGQSQLLMQNGTISRFAWDPSGRLATQTGRQKTTFEGQRSAITESNRRAAEGGQPALVPSEAPELSLVSKPGPM